MSATVSFLNVGQGHAAVVASKGVAAIVDCPHRGVDSVLAEVDAGGLDAVQAIFVTHRDLDHCGGVPALLERLDVGTVYFNFTYALPPESTARVRVKAVLSSIFSKAERDAVPIAHAYAGAEGSLGEIVWAVLAPNAYEAGRATLNDATNRASMVLSFIGAGRRFLIMGDADQVTIDCLLASGEDLQADVLLVSHHGAKIANTAALLDHVVAAYGLISVGRTNGYGHPHPDTLDELAKRPNCRIMCTQVNHLCEPSAVADSSCAGTVTFAIGADGTLTVSPTQAQHDATIAGWTSARCVVG